jgi:hypothetical protein
MMSKSRRYDPDEEESEKRVRLSDRKLKAREKNKSREQLLQGKVDDNGDGGTERRW